MKSKVNNCICSDRFFPELYQEFKGLLQDNTFNNVVSKNTYGLMGKPIVKNSLTSRTMISILVAVPGVGQATTLSSLISISPTKRLPRATIATVNQE